MSEDLVAAAVVAAINAQLTGGRQAYEIDDLPDPKPTEYVEVTASRRYVEGNPREDGGKSLVGYRIGTRYVAQTVSNARMLREATVTGLEFVALTIDGLEPTAIEYETTAIEIGPDDGWYSGLDDWTTTAADPNPK